MMRKKRHYRAKCYAYLVSHSTPAHLIAVAVRLHDGVEQLAVGGEVHQDQPALRAPTVNSCTRIFSHASM